MIATGEIVDGSLPARALRLVQEWLSEHRDELAENFELASDMQPVRGRSTTRFETALTAADAGRVVAATPQPALGLPR